MKTIKNKVTDRIALIQMFGEVESDKTLNNLMSQAGNEDDFDQLIVEIASPGGSVSEGLKIMMWLDSLSEKGKEVITIVVANAYSIASLIMLAANTRLISKHGKVMVHNPMIPEIKYVNANELEEHVSELRDLEKSMYDLYEMFTGLDKESIKTLMDNETYLSPSEAVKNGFADLVINIKPKSFEMTANKQKETSMKDLTNSLKQIMAKVNRSEFVNQTYTDTDSGVEFEVYQTDPSTYKKGDKTSLENGVVALPDGAKVTIKDYVIEEIDRAVEKEAVTEEPIVEGEPVAPIIEDVIEAPETEVPVTPIPEEAVVEPTPEEKEVIESEDPKKIIEKTESTITTKEVQNKTDLEAKVKDAEAKVAEAEANLKEVQNAFNEGSAPKEDDVKAVEKTDLEAKFEALEMKNKELEAKIVDIENKAKESKKDYEARFTNVDNFQKTSTEAFEAVASNITSNFKPEAKAKVDALSNFEGMTPFQRAKKAKELRNSK